MTHLVAKGVHIDPQFKLGSIRGLEAKDSRTLDLMRFLSPNVVAPKKWDFDHRRKAFASHMWGNDAYGDCELAARANYINRIQRAEQKKTSLITDSDIIALYKEMTGCVSPEDNNDVGMTTLDNLRQWRQGWLPTSFADIDHLYSIDAFGYVDTKNSELLRLCAYLFNGVLLGMNLPLTAKDQIKAGEPWDYIPEAGYRAEPGSWGGHMTLSKRYDDSTIYVLTWGREHPCTEAFITNYVDEGYAVIESFRAWKTYKHIFDVSKLIQQMHDLGITVNA